MLRTWLAVLRNVLFWQFLTRAKKLIPSRTSRMPRLPTFFPDRRMILYPEKLCRSEFLPLRFQNSSLAAHTS
jgi:hypothetical protein